MIMKAKLIKPERNMTLDRVYEVEEFGSDLYGVDNDKGNFKVCCKTSFELVKTTKDLLANGRVVEYRKGERRLVIGAKMMCNTSYTYASSYEEDLKHSHPICKEFDIVEVYETSAHILDDIFKDKYLTSIWKRETSEESKIKQLEQSLKDLEETHKEKVEGIRKQIEELR